MKHKILVEKKCPACGKVDYVSDSVTDAQYSWIDSHPEYPWNCPHCGHWGRAARLIDLDVIRKDYLSGERMDVLAKQWNIKMIRALAALSKPEVQEWKAFRRNELAELRAAKKAEKARAAAERARLGGRVRRQA